MSPFICTRVSPTLILRVGPLGKSILSRAYFFKEKSFSIYDLGFQVVFRTHDRLGLLGPRPADAPAFACPIVTTEIVSVRYWFLSKDPQFMKLI